MLTRRSAILIGSLVLALASFSAGTHAEEESASKTTGVEAEMAQGEVAYSTGNFSEAILRFSDAAQLAARSQQPGLESHALLRLGEAQQADGHYRDGARSLQAALVLAERLGDKRRLAATLGALGNVRIAIGPPDAAQRDLERAAQLARGEDAPGLAAAILNNLGNLHASLGYWSDALAAYTESAGFAERAQRPMLAAQALANAAHAELESGSPERAADLADQAYALARPLNSSHDKSFLLMNLGRIHGRIAARVSTERSQRRLRSFELLSEAHEVAIETTDPRAASYALGYLGALYEEEGRFDEALQLTRRAIFQAQQASAPESSYLWHWQIGRLVAAQGHRPEAIAAYERAVALLQRLRHEMAVCYGVPTLSFRESVGPVYFELVDLLLQAAAETSDPGREQVLLRSARDTVEALKAAELRDYLRDDCADALRSKITAVEEVSSGALVVYPIVLADRVELLLGLPDGSMKRYSKRVGSKVLEAEVRKFRGMLEKRISREYLPHAQQLYAWLVAPFAEELAALDVDTLVFVPDGPLRTVPMAALHDGERFLVESYAVAVTPGVQLTDPRPLDREKLKLLLSGISKPLEGYPALFQVPIELQSVRDLAGGQVLLDEAFLLQGFEDILRDEQFNVVHIATHGEFHGEAAENFLLAHDGRLTMDRLEDYVGLFRFRETPLELLTLSACDTAVGDDRAALGLSGIAVKAGARSALGTLWKVNDSASARLVIEFYRQLQSSGVSRAGALQRAQLELLKDLRYWHPGYWSAFVLISSWL